MSATDLNAPASASAATPLRPTIIVLASGRGERFRASGGAVHKLQALLGGKPVLQHTLDAVRASGLRWHLEDAGHPGMGDSIAAAVRATPDAAGWLVLPADLPLVRADTLRRVADALSEALNGALTAACVRNALAVQPVYRGERGHPVAFAAACRNDLATLDGPRGAAAVLQTLRRQGQAIELPVDDAGVLADIDTLDDLARAERLLSCG